ncbi:putative copper ion binding protein [Tripterygium wilfordii]|uniref:Putative copper ion binding protein n=1 Tax=Tripterygium wilfordii TaxID=458696 RepID=A0A7J7DF35_TRIWF|nr:blue copper protein-like [Tripterygium wilfordii]KAF5745005.1 putative copper ion binding protein [Tripterygium wilfordii]
MEERRCCGLSLLSLGFSCILLLISFTGSVQAYKNYTVGDSLGWYDNSQKPKLNYQKWADDDKIFSLGDFLIFNTDNNHSVVQTYNFTTYKLCDDDDALSTDTTEWSVADPSATATYPVTVAVPLVKEGMSYFFSGDYDGDQCKDGQHFKINVTHGQGLPESLKSPSEQAPAPNSPDVDNADSAPDTVVNSDFNHPHDEDEDHVKKDSGSISLYVNLLGMKLLVSVILVAMICIF